jgi:hypothetical protein
MNREEVDHGCSPEESEKVEVEKEGQESCREKEDGRKALRVEEEVHRKEKEENGAKESGCEEEISVCAEQAGRAEARRAEARARCSCAGCIRSCRRAEPSYLSPVQPAGGRRQFG